MNNEQNITELKRQKQKLEEELNCFQTKYKELNNSSSSQQALINYYGKSFKEEVELSFMGKIITIDNQIKDLTVKNILPYVKGGEEEKIK
jgi:hypothetical protein